MKTGIHPTYNQITVTCACGNTFETGSTLKENLRVEICSNCHPLYTGKSNLIDTAGRLDRFKARQAAALKHQEGKAGRSTAAAVPTEPQEEVPAETAEEPQETAE